METPLQITPPRQQLIHANTDTEAVLQWLAEHSHSPNTLRSYRKESERLLRWLYLRQQRLADMKRQDVLDYRRFLANPHPACDWIGPARPRTHPEWKPFTAPLSEHSIQHSLTILAKLFGYLNDAGYLQGNPFRLGRQNRQKTDSTTPERFLDRNAWQQLLDTIEQLPTSNIRNLAQQARARWIVQLLYYSGCRRSEAANGLMGDFFKRNERWWWRVHGKTGTADIPVHPQLLAALQAYRQHLGMSSLPERGDATPLICRLQTGKQGWQGIGDKALYLVCKELFRRAAQQSDTPEVCKMLLAASTHWLRHTSASHQLDAGIDLLMVSQNLRHRSIQTTRRYLHTEDNTRHDALGRWLAPSDKQE